ncbi:hypothetical protein MKEN_00238300 [Mycena kentingensis (nom. inval.)]|nr:hypothetical protein MKEN_00238300 [Mycena kentingensis (nom. inval.)]
MSFTELSDDVLLLVCLDLPPASITNLRQVCRALNAVTRSRFLWITLLRILLSQGAVMPRYVGEYDRLDAIVLERLVRRLSLVAWNAISTIEPHNPRLHANIMFQLSITWLRLVAGNWLFVAASNDAQSTITCHDLSDPSRTAWAYLPGRVKTGEVNVQNGAIVLALGLAYEASAVHVLTLRKCTERNVLCELARIERSSHVLMLCGALVGCAIRGTANLPHLCDWKTKTVYEIPPPPGGLDIPSRRSVPHLIAMWRNDIVVVRASGLELYRFQSKPASITFLQLVEAPTIWEVAYLAVDADSASLRLPIISPKGIELLQLWHCSGDIRCTRRSLVEISSSTDSFQSGIQEAPFYNLGVGASSRRIFWISALCTTPRHKRPRLRLLHMAIPPVDVEERRITAAVDEQERRVTPHFIDFEGMPDPGIWGDAMVDFDDALGTVVVGNCFGEVSIYDHAAKQGQWSVPLTPDVADLRDPLPPFAPWARTNTSRPSPLPPTTACPRLLSQHLGRLDGVTTLEASIQIVKPFGCDPVTLPVGSQYLRTLGTAGRAIQETFLGDWNGCTAFLGKSFRKLISVAPTTAPTTVI